MNLLNVAQTATKMFGRSNAAILHPKLKKKFELCIQQTLWLLVTSLALCEIARKPRTSYDTHDTPVEGRYLTSFFIRKSTTSGERGVFI